MRRERKWLVQGVTVVLGFSVLAAVAGCGILRGVPLVSKPKVMTGESFEEQLVWIERQADAAIDALGIPDGWYWAGGDFPEFLWSGKSADRSPILGSILPLECGGPESANLRLILKNVNERDDYLEVADRMQAFLESEGWIVSNVMPPTDRERNFRADREDGALIGFIAMRDGLSIAIYSSCSMHGTMANWPLHLDDESDPFQEKLDRREQQQ